MSLEHWLGETRRWVEAGLEQRLADLPDAPPLLVEACRYSLLGGGKRLRPALVRLGAELAGGGLEQALLPALAIEMLHTYSLVHDDLPSMDDDDLRRGRPTCHKVYGEAMAVLVGDALQALAFECLAACNSPRAAAMVAVLARAAGPEGMVGGQVLDLAAPVHSASEVVRAIHLAKTARLITAALELGGLAAQAGPELCERLRRLGLALGLCFQAVDDVLDVTGDPGSLGKTPGKDQAHDKATLVQALGLDGARAEAARLADQARAALAEIDAPAVRLGLELVERLLHRRG